ncbi:MAG: leucine-rich repeat protein, partial [Clostridia bacterium]|nr:leucine-rich repeat protein [Clostridia bacterium]
FEKLYISRKLTETDANKQEIGVFESPEELLQGDSISFIYGPAGCGKSQYINQIRASAGEDDLVISLRCADAYADGKSLKEILYEEFASVCGNREFYTFENFGSLLSRKRLVLILDGMDEIGTEESTRKFVQKVDKYYASNEAKTILIFTGRNEKDAALLSFSDKEARRFRLDKLTGDDIKTLSKKLFVLFKNEDKEDGFYASVQEINDEIRTNPLLLSQLALIYNYDPENMPRTETGILEAVSKITLRFDGDVKDIREQYRDMIRYDIDGILKEFAKKRYISLSDENTKNDNLTATDIFCSVFNDESNVYNYKDDSRKRAEQLVKYLQKRAIMVEDRFYHKMFLEYFTAVAYFEQVFDEYGKIKANDVLEELFSHYENEYWSPVIKMFLVKADSKLTREQTGALYGKIITENRIFDYTLLFDTCRDLINHKVPAQTVLVCDILLKSVNGAYPPYGPLFWYVPEYRLYDIALMTLDTRLRKEKRSVFAKALALVRDICCIFAQKYTVSDVTGDVNGKEIFELAKGKLTGVRRMLCEYFCVGKISDKVTPNEENVYPRCFNIRETVSLHQNGYGVPALMTKAFKDTLGMYKHTSLNLVRSKTKKADGKSKKESFETEHIGFISVVNDTDKTHFKLEHPSNKVRGIAVAPSSSLTFGYLPFTRTSVTAMYIPENVVELSKDYDRFTNLDVKLSLKTVVFSLDKAKRICRIIYVLKNRRRFFVSDPDVINCGAFSNFKSAFELYLADGIEDIGIGAFSGSTGLFNIRLPETLKHIEMHAFFDCSLLQNIVLPSSLEYIRMSAFWGCNSIRQITVPKKITAIEESVFHGCSELKAVTLPQSLREIGKNAFKSCKQLARINTPRSLEKIGNYAFYGCHSLEKFDFPESVQSIDQYAFSECKSLKKIKLPDSLKAISPYAFSRCENLSEIILPKGLTEIYTGAFSGCKVSKLELPDSLERIYSSAFSGCSNLTEVYFPKSIKHVDTMAFMGCRRLERIFIPDSILTIESRSFMLFEIISEIRIYRNPDITPQIEKIKDVVKAFNALNTVKKIFIPQYYEDIANTLSVRRDIELFCTETGVMIQRDDDENDLNGTVLKIPEGVQEILDYKYQDSSAEVIILPSSLKNIGNSAFRNCAMLTRIEFPAGLTKIGNRAFEGCEALTEIALPDKINVIPPFAFRNCNSLKTVALPKGLTHICASAFDGCSRLTAVEFPEKLRLIGSSAFKECSGLTEIRIPPSVTTFESAAFWRCSSLRKVELPEGLTAIPDRVFDDCVNLKEINIPESVTKIGREAFAGCSSLPMPRLPSELEEIEGGAFEDCHGITEIDIPVSVSKIDSGAFTNCINLERAYLHDSVKLIRFTFNNCSALKEVDFTRSSDRFVEYQSIGGCCFKNCVNLKTVRLPKTLTGIEPLAFEGCASLEELELPEKVEMIDREAFKNCVNLKRIKLPANLKTIRNGAFRGCVNLEFIEIPETVTDIGDGAFEGCEKLNPGEILNLNFKARANIIFGLK